MGNNTSGIVIVTRPPLTTTASPVFLSCGLDIKTPELPYGVKIGNESKFEPTLVRTEDTSLIFYEHNKSAFPCTWTCDDYKLYVHTTNTVQHLIESFSNYAFNNFTHYTNAERYLIASIALILTFLFCFTLASPKLDGALFYYLRAIALANFGFSVLRFYLACLPYLGGLYFYLDLEVAIANGMNAYAPFWAIIDDKRVDAYMQAAKLNACAMTFFMNLDRFMAYMTPLWYDRLNTKKFFAVAFVVSFFIGCLELEKASEFSFEWVTTRNRSYYKIKQIPDGTPNSIYTSYISKIIMSLKYAIVAFCLVSTICIIHTIRARRRKIRDMLTPVALVQETNKMVYLAKLQIIDTILTIVDTLTSLYSVCALISKNFNSKVMALGFLEGHICVVWKACALLILGEIFVVLDILGRLYQNTGHCELFLIYLIFFRRFREAFVSNLKIVFWDVPMKVIRMIRGRCVR